MFHRYLDIRCYSRGFYRLRDVDETSRGFEGDNANELSLNLLDIPIKISLNFRSTALRMTMAIWRLIAWRPNSFPDDGAALSPWKELAYISFSNKLRQGGA